LARFRQIYQELSHY